MTATRPTHLIRKF